MTTVEYLDMKIALQTILDLISACGNEPGVDLEMEKVVDAISAFVERFP